MVVRVVRPTVAGLTPNSSAVSSRERRPRSQAETISRRRSLE